MKLPSGGGFELAVAGPEDAADVCRLFREVHLPGELDVNLERDPDPFALLRLHGGTPIPLIVRERGVAVACASVTLRPGWLDGRTVTTGYLGDLRVKPGFRGGASLARLYQPVLDALREAHGVELFTTVVFDGNTVARAALMGAGAVRRGQPVYRPMTEFSMAAVQLVLPKRKPARAIHEARPSDRDELVSFLARRSRDRLLGEDLTAERFDDRLGSWPGLELEHFLLAREGGRLVGCLAPWDSGPVKRTRVLGYHGRFRWVKRAMDVGSRLLRFPALPKVGDCFRFDWLTHLEVDDPGVFHDLLRAAYRSRWARRPQMITSARSGPARPKFRPCGLRPPNATVGRSLSGPSPQFLAAMIPRGSPLQAGLRGFFVQHTPMTLYAVHARGSRWEARSFLTDRPGFEMALS
jgi:hypothetical protein